MPNVTIRFTVYFIAELKRDLLKRHSKRTKANIERLLNYYIKRAEKIGVPHCVIEAAEQAGGSNQDVTESEIICQYLSFGYVELKLL